ncbi:MAG: proline dehydrogenase family protein [Myxococcota bacterium]|jgi:RHH-type proline utilization regulon transcriptional repressor/proline dehydrogenase/delta 1-pyrroline-5-carboxylate dehydrogenase|nr:proline dehydrogenase family protein [Myxococcota bacterium]
MARVTLEDRTLEIGKELFAKMEGQTPSVFDTKWWTGMVMEWSMKDPAFKLEMFRFVDVFPQLRSSDAITSHLREYFTRPGQNFPTAIQLGIKAGSIFAGTIDKNMQRMAKQFVAGENAEEAFDVISKMRKEGLGFTVDLLGEKTLSDAESMEYQKRYLELVDGLAKLAASWEPHPVLDRDDEGPIPRVNVSIKVSSLDSQASPVDGERSASSLHQRLKPVFLRAKEVGASIMLDLEHYALKNITYDLFELLLNDPDLKDGPDMGVVVQAYLLDSKDDLEDIIKKAKKAKRRISIRLVKGAYWDYETVTANQNGWKVPVFQDKAATDQNYELLTDLILKSKHVKLALASHNVRSIAHCLAQAEALGVPKGALEFQTLFGMAEPIKKTLIAMGYRVRDYTTVGDMVPGMAYLVRRLLENTSNESFLRSKFVDKGSVEQLLSAPKPQSTTIPVAPRSAWGGNFPHADFRYREPARELSKAIAQMEKKGLGQTLPVVVGGDKRSKRKLEASVYPANPDVIVAQCALAETADIEEAIAISRKHYLAWSRRPAKERADILRKAARIMTDRRWELTALQVFEVAKNWEEADADVGEAIDFCNYYAYEAERLGEGIRLGVEPGEHNVLSYQALGVGAIIAPWNFPLAIITGMTVAGLVAGNAVLIKPARTSPAIAYGLFEILMKAGVPKEVCHFVPCVGAQVGPAMVEHPGIDFITFTGSMEVGLDIIKRAAVVQPGQRNVKRVITEMGGKNAIVIDDDADLDEAVGGVVKSAFGFQGQKCSACSRAIVVGSAYEPFVNRLIEATRSLVIGEPTSPSHLIGPVIDARSQARIKKTIEEAKKDFTVGISRDDVPEKGYYVPPTVFLDCDPKHSLCQDEIFGPVLAVIKAKDFDEALAIANGTAFALTGAVYSRSPLHIEQARVEFDCGNLYINRGSTGAMVGRQAFGGSKMSGVGSKAGGPDYLQQFMEPKCVTENTMRRGFSPETL